MTDGGDKVISGHLLQSQTSTATDFARCGFHQSIPAVCNLLPSTTWKPITDRFWIQR